MLDGAMHIASDWWSGRGGDGVGGEGGGDMWRVDRKAIPIPPTQGHVFVVHAAWCAIGFPNPGRVGSMVAPSPAGVEGLVAVVLAS